MGVVVARRRGVGSAHRPFMSEVPISGCVPVDTSSALYRQFDLQIGSVPHEAHMDIRSRLSHRSVACVDQLLDDGVGSFGPDQESDAPFVDQDHRLPFLASPQGWKGALQYGTPSRVATIVTQTSGIVGDRFAPGHPSTTVMTSPLTAGGFPRSGRVFSPRTAGGAAVRLAGPQGRPGVCPRGVLRLRLR